MAKTRPDSFAPRRLMNDTSTTSTTATPTRNGKTAGKADASCATAEETETATVRM